MDKREGEIVSVYLRTEDMEIIREAAKLDKRNISNFFKYSANIRAKILLSQKKNRGDYKCQT